MVSKRSIRPLLLLTLMVAPAEARRIRVPTPRSVQVRVGARSPTPTSTSVTARGSRSRVASRHAAADRPPIRRAGTGTSRQTRTVAETTGNRGGRPAPPPRVVGAARRGNYSQANLRDAWGAAAARRQPLRFQKDAVVAGYPIPANARGLADLPTPVRDLLGKVDRTKYTDAYIRQHRGDHVMVQFKKDGTPDLYVSSGSRSAYDVVSDAGAGAAGAATRRQAAGIGVEPGSLQLLRKRELTEMRPASELGLPVARERSIAAPWGGTQTKPAGADAYIVKNGDEFYMVQADGRTGLPIGYRAAELAPVQPRPKPSEGGLAAIFGL